MNIGLVWSIGLMLCWLIVSLGQINQGIKIRNNKSIENVSLLLPVTVFSAQTFLFIKGMVYSDWSLIAGAIVVNIGAAFNIYCFLKEKRRKK